METPGSRNLELTLDRSMTPYLDKFLAGGPGCYWCREVAAQGAADVHASDVRGKVQAFLAAPDIRSAASVLAAVRGAAPDQIKPVLSAIGGLAGSSPTTRILRVQLEPHRRAGAKLFAVTTPLTTVLASFRAVSVGHALVTEDCRIFLPHIDGGWSDSSVTVGTQVVYIAHPSGGLPEFRFKPAEQGGWHDSHPSPALWRFKNRVVPEAESPGHVLGAHFG